MKVLFVASEATPYGSTGGLADVAYALPAALQRAGVDIARVMPFYTRHVQDTGRAVRDTGTVLQVPMGMHSLRAEVWKTEDDQPATYFIRRDEYFDRSELYSLPQRDYEDNFERFVFFQKAAIELADVLKLAPDVIHCNDWQAGLLPLFVRHGIRGMGRAAREKTVFTIHNLAFQGLFPGSLFALTNLPFSTFTMDGMEFYGQLNFMKAGIVYADRITTVSRTYASEIQTEPMGCGLHDILTAHKGRLHGIVNGVDHSVWDPASDPFLRSRYDADDMRGKRLCRRDLAEKMGLKVPPDRPLVGMVSRLTEQKGLDILAAAIDGIMAEGVCFALLGTGQEHYHELCRQWAAKWPGQFAVRLDYDNALAHQIEGGADIFLMPSHYEPCGLNQLYSLRYGALPIVHATGGLKDTITDLAAGEKGNGLVMADYSASSLTECVKRAVALYQDRGSWLALMKRIMRQDWSWDASAAEYIRVYLELS